MRKIKSELSNIFIDIDDTITSDMGKTFINGAIEAIKLISLKVNIFIWSQGGVEYANEIVEIANIKEYVCAVLPKPDLMIDDLSVKDWSGLLKINASNPLGWDKLKILSNQLEGDWIEDNPLLREIK
jgi:hypothetical protein